jgi:hypothetical protein
MPVSLSTRTKTVRWEERTNLGDGGGYQVRRLAFCDLLTCRSPRCQVRVTVPLQP